MLDVTHENPESKTIEIIIDGKVTTEAMELLFRKIESKASEWGKINILERYVAMDGFEPRVLWIDLRLYFRNRDYFNKVAIVTDKKWVKALTKMIGPFFKVDVKVFSNNQLQEARAWLT